MNEDTGKVRKTTLTSTGLQILLHHAFLDINESIKSLLLFHTVKYEQKIYRDCNCAYEICKIDIPNLLINCTA